MECNTENPNCAVGQCVSWRCSQCEDRYFKKSFDYPCASCAYHKDEKEKQHEFRRFLF